MNPLKIALAAASIATVGITALALLSPVDHDARDPRLIAVQPGPEPQQPPIELLGDAAPRPAATHTL